MRKSKFNETQFVGMLDPCVREPWPVRRVRAPWERRFERGRLDSCPAAPRRPVKQLVPAAPEHPTRSARYTLNFSRFPWASPALSPGPQISTQNSCWARARSSRSSRLLKPGGRAGSGIVGFNPEEVELC
jgi:hypothetical protein